MYTLADSTLPVFESVYDDKLEIYRFKFLFDNYLKRAKAFGKLLQYKDTLKNL